jgi:hypothetical protein
MANDFRANARTTKEREPAWPRASFDPEKYRQRAERCRELASASIAARRHFLEAADTWQMLAMLAEGMLQYRDTRTEGLDRPYCEGIGSCSKRCWYLPRSMEVGPRYAVVWQMRSSNSTNFTAARQPGHGGAAR